MDENKRMMAWAEKVRLEQDAKIAEVHERHKNDPAYKEHMKMKAAEEREPHVNSYWCKCEKCEFRRRRRVEHLDHPFYAKVREIVADVEHQQIIKGAEKYPEPFNPHNWTPKELLQHLMQELRDGQVYGVGLFELIEKLEKEVAAERRGFDLIEKAIDQSSDAKAIFADFHRLREQETGELPDVRADLRQRIDELEKELKSTSKAAEFWKLKYIREIGATDPNR